MMQEFPGGQPPELGNGREFASAINGPVQSVEDSAYEALAERDSLEDIPHPEDAEPAPSAEKIGSGPDNVAALEPAAAAEAEQEPEAKPADGVVDEAAVVQRAAEAVQAKRADRAPQPIAAEGKTAKDEPGVDPEEVDGELEEMRPRGESVVAPKEGRQAAAPAAAPKPAVPPIPAPAQPETADREETKEITKVTKPAAATVQSGDDKPAADSKSGEGNDLPHVPVTDRKEDTEELPPSDKPPREDVDPVFGPRLVRNERPNANGSSLMTRLRNEGTDDEPPFRDQLHEFAGQALGDPHARRVIRSTPTGIQAYVRSNLRRIGGPRPGFIASVDLIRVVPCLEIVDITRTGNDPRAITTEMFYSFMRFMATDCPAAPWDAVCFDNIGNPDISAWCAENGWLRMPLLGGEDDTVDTTSDFYYMPIPQLPYPTDAQYKDGVESDESSF